jgi:hypothetical protein
MRERLFFQMRLYEFLFFKKKSKNFKKDDLHYKSYRLAIYFFLLIGTRTIDFITH